MKKKINSKFMLISAIAIIVMAICAMVLFYDILKKQIFDDLKANAHVISMMKPEDLPDEINYNLNKDGLRITLINEDGTVIYDSMEDESKMENHRERPEIASALAAGEGRAMRKSTTSAKHTFYYAIFMLFTLMTAADIPTMYFDNKSLKVRFPEFFSVLYSTSSSPSIQE